MNSSLFKGEKDVLRMHVLDTPAPSLIGPRSAPRNEPTNPFGVEFRECFDKAAMAQQDFAEVLSLELKRPVSQVNVSNWLRGVEPRSSAAHPNLADEVLVAARHIAENEFVAGRGKHADPEKVRAQFCEWEAAGLTAKQVQLAAEISVTLYRAWREGITRIPTTRWEVAQTKVNMWKDFIAENQKKWQAAAEREKLARTRDHSAGAKEG